MHTVISLNIGYYALTLEDLEMKSYNCPLNIPE